MLIRGVFVGINQRSVEHAEPTNKLIIWESLMNRYQSAIGLTLMSILLTNCATVTRGSNQAFTVTSEPNGAEVRFSSGLTCTTPCTLTMKRRPGFAVTVSKDGYDTQTANVVSQISGGGGTAMAGNVILGGLIGAGVDASTGAMNELVPNPLHIVLDKADD